MNRLEFTLPDFTRLSWTSDAARQVWEPRLARITAAWLELEWRSVVAGIRSCGILMATPEALIERAGRCARRGLTALPVEIQRQSETYSATTPVPRLGEPFVFRLVVGTPAHVTEFKEAWDAHDDVAIGRLLGYPPCCLDFFQRVWGREGHVDTTWHMALATTDGTDGATMLDVAGPPEANILWRWMGVRAVPHLPCSFACAPTVELARAFLDLGKQEGFGEEMDWMREILAWPVEWSALHGIAEVRTPILRVSTRTDATPRTYVVRREGTAYPAEGARGLAFPYRVPGDTAVAGQRLQRALEHPIRVLDQPPAWYASDNGFASVAAMEAAHGPVVQVALSALDGGASNVLDLGCGNGALLKRLRDSNPGVVPFGVDSDAARAAHAAELLPDCAANFLPGDLFDNDALWREDRPYALVLLMPGRLLEVTPDKAARLRERLETHARAVLVYAYGDWLTKYRGLAGLASRAGFQLLSSGDGVTASLARSRAGELAGTPFVISNRGGIHAAE